MKLVIFGILIVIIIGLIIGLPVITINSAAVISSSGFAYIRAILYFIPAGTVAAILSIILGLWILRVIISLIRTIWDLLPVV